MRILMLGAGGVGGYFGGRMVQAGSDVTFLVRPGRAAQLRDGLRIESPHGDAVVPVKTLTGPEPADAPFDVIVLSCKAYGLDGALDAIAPFVGAETPILPLLNGLNHIDAAAQRFPEAVVLGGSASIAATLTADGVVRQMGPVQTITVGLLPGQQDPGGLLPALTDEMTQAGIKAVLSDNVRQLMWDKWTFLCTLAAATGLMRGTVGEILATDHGEAFMVGLYDECNRTATAEGYPPNPSPVQDYRGMLFSRQSPGQASMARDIEAGNPTEADHVVGDMIRRAGRYGIETPFLNTAYSMLQVYEAKRTTKA